MTRRTLRDDATCPQCGRLVVAVYRYDGRKGAELEYLHEDRSAANHVKKLSPEEAERLLAAIAA